MAVEIHSFNNITDSRTAIEDQLLRILQSQSDLSVSTSKQLLHRTGHARFRRGPSDLSTTSTSDQSTQNYFTDKPNMKAEAKISEKCKSTDSLISSVISLTTGEEATVSNGKLGLLTSGVPPTERNFSSAKPPLPSSHRKRFRDTEQCKSNDSPILSGSSSITGEEGTVSNGKKVGWLLNTGVVQATRTYSSAKPPLPSSHRKTRREVEQVSGERLSSHGCHCCKRRKKIEIITGRIRINIGTSSSSSIPSDEYSWKKYEQKLIRGTSSRGGYYKCSSAKGCSARKHVIKDHNDPTVLIVTYKGEHNHQLLNGSDLSRTLVKSR